MHLTDALPAYLKQKQALVEEALRRALVLGDDCPATLAEAMAYSLLGGGKRLRPLLVILTAEACGGRDVDALPAGCAVEMIHTYSLIHDDLPAMDDDDLRRGQPTSHKKFGEAMAILAGDALLTLAFQVLAEGYPPATAAACCRELARGAGAAGMVGGQVEDLAWEKRGGTLDALMHLHARKTGALFLACVRLGLWVAHQDRPPDPALLERFAIFGARLGLVFQITDDLLDVEGSDTAAGKRVGKDAARGKLTYPGFLGVEESRRRAATLVRQARADLEELGPAAHRLSALLQSILERDR
jgi:geranylgeranyl diphosphate synthase type II